MTYILQKQPCKKQPEHLLHPAAFQENQRQADQAGIPSSSLVTLARDAFKDVTLIKEQECDLIEAGASQAVYHPPINE